MGDEVRIITPNNAGGLFAMNSGGGASVAHRLLSGGFNENVLRPWEENGRGWTEVTNSKGQLEVVQANNATLRRDEWKHFDDAIMKAARTRLVITNKLINLGLTHSVSNALGKMVLEYQKVNDIDAAHIGMDPNVMGQEDMPEFSTGYLPLPMIFKPFRINIRQLQASRTLGESLDTTAAEQAGRRVAEKIEEMTLVGASSYAYAGGTIYGLRDFTSANSVTLTAHWDDSLATGSTMLDDVVALKQAAIDDRFFGPYGLLIPTNFETALDKDFKSNSDKSVRERLMDVDGIEFIQVCDSLTADYVVLFQLTQDVMREVMGMGITTLQWESNGGLQLHFLVMAIMIPQPRADYDGRCGICVGSL